MATLAEVQALDALGFNVVPARRGDKAPLVDWQKWQTRRSTSMLPVWWGDNDYNAYIICGQVSRLVVLDIDNDEADQHWREILGETLDSTATVRTSKGYHYYFRTEGERVAGWSVHSGGLDFDVRGEGGGVIGPHSTHSSGHIYDWVRGPELIQPLPDELRGRDALPSNALPLPDSSTLTQLLLAPPDAGGRNVWLTQVVGHLAKHIPFDDAVGVLAHTLNDSLGSPMPSSEVNTTVNSVLSSEHRKPATPAVPGGISEANGFIHSDGQHLWTECGQRNQPPTWERFSNFDVRVISVIAHDEGDHDYKVRVTRDTGDAFETLLLGADIGSPKKLGEWFGARGCVLFSPDGMKHKGGWGRVAKFVMAQDAPVGHTVEELGWSRQANGFVCHEGIITAEGLSPHGAIVPHPKLQNWAPYRYGFSSQRDATETLAEILMFHDPTSVAVIASWAMACFLKPQIMERTALFPFLAVEAPSGSGKSTGFMPMLIGITGNTTGAGEFTMAALRDMTSATRNGIVWMDDLADFDTAYDLVRQSTADGQRAKKGVGNFKQETVGLHAPLVLSGESMGALHTEQALLDRALLIGLPPVTDRRSSRDPSQSQWADIVAMRERWPDLSIHAGTLLSLALSYASIALPMVGSLGSTRVDQRNSIVLCGAKLLDLMLDTEEWTDRVLSWVSQQASVNYNMVITDMIPAVWRGQTAFTGELTPVYLSNGQLRVVVPLLCQAYAEIRHLTPRQRSLARVPSVAAQLAACGATRGRTEGSRGDTRRKCWILPMDVTDAIVRATDRVGEGAGTQTSLR